MLLFAFCSLINGYYIVLCTPTRDSIINCEQFLFTYDLFVYLIKLDFVLLFITYIQCVNHPHIHTTQVCVQFTLPYVCVHLRKTRIYRALASVCASHIHNTSAPRKRIYIKHTTPFTALHYACLYFSS